MNPIADALRCAALILTVSVAGPAVAQAVPPDDQRGPDPRAVRNAQAVDRADAAFKQARELCLRHPVDAQEACLDEARDAHAKALVIAAGSMLPALQTQSAAVSDTGVTPVPAPAPAR